MAIFLHILPNMENVIFKSVDFIKLEITLHSSIFKVGETKVVPEFTIHRFKCHFQHI